MKQTYRYSALVGIASLMTTGLYAGQEAIQMTPEKPTSWLNSSGIVGHFGLSAGMNSVDVDDDGNDGFVSFGLIDGSVTIPVLENNLLVFDGYIRYDNFESSADLSDDEDPAWEATIGTHFLHQFTEDTRAGVFFGYGDTCPQNGDYDDGYNVLMYGLEAQSFVTDNLMIFGQLGYGQKGRDGQDSGEGFKGGMLGRLGASYFPNQISAITLDLEAAETKSYIDGSDRGQFLAATLSYQRLLTSDLPLYVTCFGSYDLIDGTTEGDAASEWQVGIGFRYYFGAESPKDAARKGLSIGTPRLPTRASAWEENLD